MISLKILDWVTGLVNFLSGIFESWSVNSEKMVNLWCYAPPFLDLPPLLMPTFPHLSYLVNPPSPHY